MSESKEGWRSVFVRKVGKLLESDMIDFLLLNVFLKMMIGIEIERWLLGCSAVEIQTTKPVLTLEPTYKLHKC